MAMVILMALLILGAPFLFNQSSALSGVRSFARAGQAQTGVSAVAAASADAVAAALAPRWAVPFQEVDGAGVNPWQVAPPGGYLPPEYTDLAWFLFNAPPTSPLAVGSTPPYVLGNHPFAITDYGTGGTPHPPGSVGLDFSVWQQPTFYQPVATQPTAPPPTAAQLISGATIEDEDGKLDPNDLDGRSWLALLTSVGISDPPPGFAGTTGSSPNQVPPLSTALAQLRAQLTTTGTGRITDLDQLLQATPIGVPPLTASGLDLLRPYLSLRKLAQARQGLIDLGTVVQSVTTGSGTSLVAQTTTDAADPQTIVAYPPAPLLRGPSTWLGYQVADTVGSPSPVLYTQANGTPGQAALPVDAPVGIDAPSAVNINQAAPPVEAVLYHANLSHPAMPSPGMTLTTSSFPTSGCITHDADLVSLACGGGAPPQQLTDSFFTPLDGFRLLGPLITADVVTAALLVSQLDDLPVTTGPPPNDVPSDALALRLHSPLMYAFASLPATGVVRIDSIPSPAASSTPPLSQPYHEYVAYGSMTVDGGDAGSGAAVILGGLTRGLYGSQPQSFEVENPAVTCTATFIQAREVPPLDISSHGVITVDAATTAVDQLGRPDAQSAQRVVMQALPHEYPLTVAYTTQEAVHALLAQRHGSLMTSFPVPYPRLRSAIPSQAQVATMTTSTVVDPADAQIGVRPAVLLTAACQAAPPAAPVDWAVPAAGSDPTTVFNAYGAPQSPVTPASVAVSDPAQEAPGWQGFLTPEGVCLNTSGGAGLAYANAPPEAPGLGFCHDAPGSTETPLQGRQCSFWIKLPTADPQNVWQGTVVLAEMRMPSALTGSRIQMATAADATVMDPRTAGSTDTQNHWMLRYDGAAQELVLGIANGCIDQQPGQPYGPAIPGGSSTIGGSDPFLIDPMSLGSNTGSGFPDLTPVAPAPPRAQMVEEHYAAPFSVLGDGAWHQIGVVFASDHPGGLALMVDGIVGRDVQQMAGAIPPATTQLGDHYQWPIMTLASALPAASADGFVPAIALTAQGPYSVSQLLPAHGIVRIDQEYIRYDAINGSALIHCLRGCRQSVAQPDPARVDTLAGAPCTTVHAIGSLVYAGGYRIPQVSASFLTGGCTLAPLAYEPSDQTAPATDPSSGAPAFVAEAMPSGGGPSVVYLPLAGNQAGESADGESLLPGVSEIFAQPTVIHAAANPDTPHQHWPIRGYFRLVDSVSDPAAFTAATTALPQIYYYDNSLNAYNVPPDQPDPATGALAGFHNLLSGIVHSQNGDSPPTPTLSAANTAPATWSTTSPPFCAVLCSMELQVPSLPAGFAITASTYALGNLMNGAPYASQAGNQMLQIYDQAEGHIEWLTYDAIVASPAGASAPASAPLHAFIVDYAGFPWWGWNLSSDHRGLARTEGPYRYDGTLQALVAGSRVIPVQTATGNWGHVLETGDVVTLAPSAPTVATGYVPIGDASIAGQSGSGPFPSTFQMVVRYHPSNAFCPVGNLDNTAAGEAGDWTPYDGDFAFSDALPLTVSAQTPSAVVSPWTAFTGDILCWPCWNGVDQSVGPYNGSLPSTGWAPATTTEQRIALVAGLSKPLDGVSGLMPWVNAFTGQSGAPWRIYFGHGDPRSTQGGAVAVGAPMEIDGLAAGPTGGWSSGLMPCTVAGWGVTPGDPGPAMASTDVWIPDGQLSSLPSAPIAFTQSLLPSGGAPVAVLIGGEAFAILPTPASPPATSAPSTQQGTLIARGLFGTTAHAHTGFEPALLLPIGPIAQLTAAQGANAFADAGAMPATVSLPGFAGRSTCLLCSADGSSMEMVGFPNQVTAPWLRGLYNTPVASSWAGSTSPFPPLAIGWNLRYPSALPADSIPSPSKNAPTTTPSGVPLGPLLRCREYAWMGYPACFYGMTFANLGSISPPGPPMLSPLSLDATPPSGLPLSIFVAAAPSGSGLSWLDSAFVPASDASLDSVFSAPPFIDPDTSLPKPVDGCEVRVVWEYTTGPIATTGSTPAEQAVAFLENLALAGSSAPTIAHVHIRFHAPILPLSVDGRP